MYELLKDWGDLKKGSHVKIMDQSVVKKGIEVGLLKLVKEENDKPKK